MNMNVTRGLLALFVASLVMVGCNQADTSDAAAAASDAATSAAADAKAKTDDKVKTAKDATEKKKDDGPIVDPNMPKTKISFEKMEHDYGQVEQKTKNAYTFKFTNTGDQPLVISKAKGSCGCTVPEYPKDPIMPGETGEIDVEYSSRTAKGMQTKMVTVWANTEPEQTQLKIKADVLAPEGEEATN